MRTPRNDIPGAVHHVTQRGNRRQAIFETPADYRVFLATLADVIDRYRWQVLSYCLMPNHVHLLVRNPDAKLSLGMRRLTGAYARRFNEAHGYTGHVFQGRFGSTLIDTDEHLVNAFRYVALNPVSAGLCALPEDWLWSAHAELIGHREQCSNVLHSEALRGVFGQRSSTTRTAYARLIAEWLPHALAEAAAPAVGGTQDGRCQAEA